MFVSYLAGMDTSYYRNINLWKNVKKITWLQVNNNKKIKNKTKPTKTKQTVKQTKTKTENSNGELRMRTQLIWLT